MKSAPKLLPALLLLLAVLLFAACGSNDGTGGDASQDGLVGDTLRVTRTGEGVSGAFLADGPFDVRIDGDNVTPDNSVIRIYKLTQIGMGYSVELLTRTAPKASIPGVQVRPGNILDVHFDIGPGEYYVLLETAQANEWTMIVTGVSGVPGG
ncbi:MAG: hypothetical protein WD904_00645 [Dehalococcoidia bacterium]